MKTKVWAGYKIRDIPSKGIKDHTSKKVAYARINTELMWKVGAKNWNYPPCDWAPQSQWVVGGSSTVKLQDLVLSLAAHLCLWLGEGEELRLCQLVTANGEPLLQLTLTLPVQEAESDVRHVVSSSISYMGVRPYISTHSNVGGRLLSLTGKTLRKSRVKSIWRNSISLRFLFSIITLTQKNSHEQIIWAPPLLF